MIAQMKKISIVLLDSDKQNSLKSLKKLGIMHLSENFGLNEDVKAIDDSIKDVESALRFTEENSENNSLKFDEDIVVDKIQQILKIGKDISELEERESILNRNLEFLEPWGEFNPSDLTILEEKGVKLTLIETSKEQYSKLSEEVVSFTIDQNSMGYLLAVVGEFEGDFKVFEPPEMGIEDTLRSLEIILSEIDEKKLEIKELSKFNGNILSYKILLEDRSEFEKVKAGMKYDEDFSVLEGWIPSEKLDNFKVKAAKNGWGIGISEPVEGDNTPTWVKSSKIVSMIHPLLDFLGNVPGYWEKDVSPYFLLFFTLFFSMIIGDAGYGLIFLSMTALVHIKLKKFNNAIGLFYLLSSATVVWGAITGNWFGSELIRGIPILDGFVMPSLTSTTNIMILCFNIAVVHLVLARLLAFIQGARKKELNSIAHIGWALMVGGLLFLVRNLVINANDFPIPPNSLIVVAIGFAIVVVFGKQEKGKNFFKSLASGLIGSLLTALDSISAFGDIISYIRLYAVGLAGLAVAQSFNAMAAPFLDGGGLGIIAGLLILLGGHAFNLAMGVLSVLVHAVRLNVLEFSSHADVNWTGIKFTPFREKEII